MTDRPSLKPQVDNHLNNEPNVKRLLIDLVWQLSDFKLEFLEEEYEESKLQEAEQIILNIINQEKAKLLDSLEQSIKQHTVPEGKHLVTRSYVLNSIEFERNRNVSS